MLVGENLDNEARGMIEDDNRLRFIPLDELGINLSRLARRSSGT